MSNPFFKNHGPILISSIIKTLNITANIKYKDQVSFGCHVSALLDCHRQTAIRQIHEFQFQIHDLGY